MTLSLKVATVNLRIKRNIRVAITTVTRKISNTTALTFRHKQKQIRIILAHREILKKDRAAGIINSHTESIRRGIWQRSSPTTINREKEIYTRNRSQSQSLELKSTTTKIKAREVEIHLRWTLLTWRQMRGSKSQWWFCRVIKTSK